jgi:hypothetical protein
MLNLGNVPLAQAKSLHDANVATAREVRAIQQRVQGVDHVETMGTATFFGMLCIQQIL